MKKLTALILTASLLLTFAAGCDTQSEAPYVPTGDGLTYGDTATTPQQTLPQEETELVLAYYPNVTMNPYLCTDFTNRALFSLLYQGLFAVDHDYNVEPMLCKSYRISEDMHSYTFYIHNATFSDGTRLTIQDVFASLLAARESSYYKGRFNHVKDIVLSEDGGITFTLDTAYENFPLLLDIPIVKEAEVADIRPLGTGPYLYERTAYGARLRLRNNWWCSAQLPLTTTSIPLVEAQSTTHIRDQFEFFDVGLVCANPCTDTYADYRCDYELWDSENGIFLYLGCNMESDVFSKSAVRAALTYAIDRDTLVETYYNSFALSASLPASPLSPYYSTQLAARYDYEPERFSQAISDAYLNGMSIRLLVNKDDSLRLRVARAIAQMLEAGGLKVELMERTRSDYVYALAVGAYDLYLGQTKLSANMDLSSFFVRGGSLRYGGMTDAATYAMCLEALANRGNYVSLHQMIMEDGRLCPVAFQSYAVYATRGLLPQLSPSRDNVFYYSIGSTMEDALLPNE